MSKIQKIQRKNGFVFRVQRMVNGKRTSKVFNDESQAATYSDGGSNIGFRRLSFMYLDKSTLSNGDIKRKVYIYNILYRYFCLKSIEDYNHKDIALIVKSVGFDRGLSESTMDRYKSAISGVFEFALNNNYIKVNPSVGVYYKRCKEKKVNILSTAYA